MMNGLNGINRKGFTLLELMIVLAVVAILVALAYPSYTQYVRKAKRGDVQQMLMSWSVNQEIYRSNNSQYAGDSDITPPSHDDYSLNASNISGSSFTLTANARNDQEKDSEDGVSCDVMTLNENGQKTPIQCWGGSSWF
jgi:type IV pilus assembly protein PilE